MEDNRLEARLGRIEGRLERIEGDLRGISAAMGPNLADEYVKQWQEHRERVRTHLTLDPGPT